MRPLPPPFFPASPPAQPGTARLGLMVKTAGELSIEIGLGGSKISDRMITELLAALGPAVSDLGRERASGRAMTRDMLDTLADKLEAAADHRAAWMRQQSESPPAPTDRPLRALIARMRLIARNT